MTSLPIPVLAKCLNFMGVGQPHLKTFQEFKSWVIANHQSGYDIRAPGNTGWQYQVPFWTKNAMPGQRQFEKYTHFVDDVSPIDETTGLQLWHGYWCTGNPANNSYSTVVLDDWQSDIWRTPYEEIIAATIGVKFYCLGEEQPKPHSREWIDPKLVTINMSLRIAKDGTLFSLPIKISTNLYSVGGHGGGTFSDATHHHFTPRHGWDSEKATNWGRDMFTTYEPEKKKVVKQYHDSIFQKLLASLAKT
jgi:hypothetical protein